MIARAAASHPPADAPSMASSSFAVIRPHGSGSPMTPVEEMKTSAGSQPSAAAPASAVRRTASSPSAPVKALALPEFTIKSRAEPWLSPLRARLARHQSTGAERVLEVVKTPAAWVRGANTAQSRSVRP